MSGENFKRIRRGKQKLNIFKICQFAKLTHLSSILSTRKQEPLTTQALNFAVEYIRRQVWGDKSISLFKTMCSKLKIRGKIQVLG